MKGLLTFLTFCIILSLSVKPSFAVSTPVSTCLNPQGTIIANHPSGIHGIVGTNSTYEGKDTVYKVSDSQALQCFCPATGLGIQTNWVKASQYSDSEIQILKNQGWVYVVTGAPWGLDDVAYVAQNVNFACSGSSNGTSSGSSNGSSNSVGGSSHSAMSVLNAATTSFARTGTAPFLFQVIGAGFLSLLLGITLKKTR